MRYAQLMSYQLEFKVEPVAKGRPRSVLIGGFVRTLTDKKTREAEKILKLLMRAQWNRPPLTGPIKVDILFLLRKPKTVKREYPTVPSDVDNYAKLVLDCMNEIVIEDDSMVIDLRVRKEYGEPSIKLVVGEM